MATNPHLDAMRRMGDGNPERTIKRLAMLKLIARFTPRAGVLDYVPGR